MKNFILLIFSVLFLNSSCEKPNFITLHYEITENDVAEFKWILKIHKLNPNYIEFEIIETKQLKNGLFDVLNEFEERVDYADFIEIKAEKKICRLKTNTINKLEIDDYFYAKVYRNQKEVFFTKNSFHKTLNFLNQEKTINSKLSALSAMGWAIEKQMILNYKISLNEIEINDFLMNNNKSFENLILSNIRTEFRSIVGRTKKENIVTETLQTELTEKLKTELKGITILNLKLVD